MNVRLAHRIQRIHPSPTVGMTARAAAMREQGRDVISLSAGEPDFDTPEPIKAAAIAAIQRGETKYTPVDGARVLKSAIAEKFRRDNRLDYASEQILVSSGAKQCCYNACLALLDTGDEAIIPSPYWVSYTEMVRLADAEPVIVRTTAEQDFLMSPERLAAAITSRTRLVIINSPCNPTGAAYSKAQWEEIGEVLREHPRVLLLTDDIYEHIYWGASPFTTAVEACPHLIDRTITVNGVSKCYAMSGWRIGYVAGPRVVIKAMTSLQSQSTTNACTISQFAAAAALTGDQQPMRDMCKAFKERHDFVVERLNQIPGFTCRPGSGTFYAFPNIAEALRAKGIGDDVQFCEALLEQAEVAVVPGSAFGAPGHLRMSFAAGLPTLTEALDRTARFIAA